MRFKSRLT